MKESGGGAKALFVVLGLLRAGAAVLLVGGALAIPLVKNAIGPLGIVLISFLFPIGLMYLYCGVSLSSLIQARSKRPEQIVYVSITYFVLSFLYSQFYLGGHSGGSYVGQILALLLDLYLLTSVRSLAAAN